MKKHLFIFFFVFLIVVSIGYSLKYGVSETIGEDGGFIVVEFREKTFFEYLQPQAIIPPYVNAGTTILFSGEMRKISDFTGFGGRYPTHLRIEIFKFDSSKLNFLGELVNKFIVPIPESAINEIKNDAISIVTFDVTMTTPTQIGKYRYKSTALYQSETFPVTQIEQDFDTFEVQQGVPEICPIPQQRTEVKDIKGGKLKIVYLIEYINFPDCIKSEKPLTYNAICNEGYWEVGTGENTRCELGAICGNGKKENEEECDDGNTVSGDGCSNVCKSEVEPPPTKCASNQVCCQHDIVVGGTGANYITETIFECISPDKCKVTLFGKLNPKVVSSEKCGGGGLTCKQFYQSHCCGDGTIQVPEECDDGNTVSGDGCSNVCKSEVEPPTTLKDSLTLKQIKQKTESALEKSLCKNDEECRERIGYNVRCAGDTEIVKIIEEKIGGFETWIKGWEGICLAEPTDGDGFDFNQLNPCSWGEKIVEGQGCLVGGAIVIFFVFIIIFSRK